VPFAQSAFRSDEPHTWPRDVIMNTGQHCCGDSRCFIQMGWCYPWGFYASAFHLSHPAGGHIYMHVLKYRHTCAA
jgi:hypothetical protein